MKICTTLQPETVAAIGKLSLNTVDAASTRFGIERGEPLLLCLDGLLRYAKAHKARYESPLAEDYVIGEPWLEALKGVHYLLNGVGAAALEAGRTTDSKSNGVLEEIYWAAIKAAGYTEEQVA